MNSPCNQNVAIIPARGGSKGLPRKNILPFVGKPLVAWTIEQALASQQINRVLVSTDSDEIASIARDFGAEVLGLRPPEISNDIASTEEVLLYECSQLVKSHAQPQNIVLLQCTSPIRFPGTIDKALIEFSAKKADSLVSVTRSHRFFWYDKINPKPSYDYKKRPRRQDILEDSIPFMETGSIYVTDFQKLMESRNRLCGQICMFETDYYESFEIDNSKDFELCEYIAKQVLINEN